MPTDADFIARILDRPGDDTPRLVYADWLDDHAEGGECPTCRGKGFRGTTWSMRYTGHGYREDVDRPACNVCRGRGSVSDGRRDRAELIRVQCGLARTPDCPDWCDGDPTKCRVAALRRREGELLDLKTPLRTHPGWHLTNAARWAFGETVNAIGQYVAWAPQFRRGFVASVRCSLADWQEHASTLLAAHPIERVEVADVPGLCFEVLCPGHSKKHTKGWTLYGTFPGVRSDYRYHPRVSRRGQLVEAATAMVEEIVARLRAAAGDRWPGTVANQIIAGLTEYADALER